MGVRINGVWHEELADPGTGGSDSGNGRNYDSSNSYSAAAGGTQMGNVNTTVGGGFTPGQGGGSGTPGGGASSGASIDAFLQAIGSGNKAAADEAIRQFNVAFGLDQSKFAEGVRQYNQSFGLQSNQQAFAQAAAAAGLTGQFQGQQTLASQQQQFSQEMTRAQQDLANKIQTGQLTLAQAAQQLAELSSQQQFALSESGLTGSYKGQQTQQAQQQEFTQQLSWAQQALSQEIQRGTLANQQNQTGIQALEANARLQSDPFAQMQVEYGIANSPGLSRAISGLGGLNGVQGLPRFQAPNGSAAGTGGIAGNRATIYGQQAGGADSSTAAPGTPNYSPQQQQFLSQFKSPTSVIARNYATADQATKDMITSAIKQNTGLDQSAIHSQIMAQLPQFASSNFGLANI